MTWWKNILKTIPALFAAYEVGKLENEQDKNNKIIEYMKPDIQHLEKEDDIDTFEIIIIVMLILMAIAYIIKSILSKRN